MWQEHSEQAGERSLSHGEEAPAAINLCARPPHAAAVYVGRVPTAGRKVQAGASEWGDRRGGLRVRLCRRPRGDGVSSLPRLSDLLGESEDGGGLLGAPCGPPAGGRRTLTAGMAGARHDTAPGGTYCGGGKKELRAAPGP